MKILVSIIIVIVMLFSVRLAHHFWEKSRRKFFAPLMPERNLIQIVEPLALNVTVDQKFLSFHPNRNHRVLGRLVIQDSCVQLSSSTGILIRATARKELEAKTLGTQRIVLLGKSPSSEVSLRIECAFPQEKLLVQQINQALQ